MSQPLVSILIPAFRPTWLDLAIASALAQTVGTFELLISDDSTGQEVQSVVSKWRDPRIRYMRNPRRGQPGSNRDNLIAEARGKYIKFLFDDDLLLPNSLELLLTAAEQGGARLAFHARHYIDGLGRVLEPPMKLEWKGYAQLNSDVFFTWMVGAQVNAIGEPTCVLLHAETVKSMTTPFAVDGRRMRFLTDMALYTNMISQGHMVLGTTEVGSAFRQHAQQTSNQSYPGHSAGLFEWELLRRWSAQHGLLSPEKFAAGNPKQMQMYQPWAARYPELQAFIELAGAPEGEGYLGPRFMAALHGADSAIADRMERRAA
jgi:Glycosyl transferase family 2